MRIDAVRLVSNRQEGPEGVLGEEDEGRSSELPVHTDFEKKDKILPIKSKVREKKNSQIQSTSTNNIGVCSIFISFDGEADTFAQVQRSVKKRKTEDVADQKQSERRVKLTKPINQYQHQRMFKNTKTKQHACYEVPEVELHTSPNVNPGPNEDES
ncbi:hypothetical protein ACROYT_G041714 [Oculina patagonica]